jgi:predicted amidohydrolase
VKRPLRVIAALCVLGFSLAVQLVALATPAWAKTVRVFAVGSKVEIRYADTYENFRDKMFALFDRRHPRREELVQVDVDDVASHLEPSEPGAPELALVNFPEDVGLVAGLIGSRGAGSRRITVRNGGSQFAFGLLLLQYDPQIQYYLGQFPGLLPVRYLLLAETDTFYRAFYETFRDLARTYRVYLTAAVNVAPARRVEAAEQPTLVTLLRDPDEAQARDYAYVAQSPDVFNTTFIFDPDGNVLVPTPDGQVLRSPTETGGLLRGSLSKAYLTEAEEDTLPLSFGRVRDLDVVDTPVGRLASVTSKDAWMIDVNDRYDAKGANLIVQPEAFSEWAYVAAPWQPDGYKAGGFAQVQRNPNFRYNVAASMTGNLFDVTFDGQSSLVGKRQKTVAPPLTSQSAWIGQNPDSGFLSIAPWTVDDLGIGDPSVSLAQRRSLLATVGAQTLPGATPACPAPTAFGACENGYRESVIYADVELPDGPDVSLEPDQSPRVPTAFGVSVPVAADDVSAQTYARVAASGANVYVTWQEAVAGMESVFLAVSHDRGEHFVRRWVSDNPPGTLAELRPALGVSRDGQDVFVVWQEFCAGHDDDCGRIKLARFDANGDNLSPDIRVDRDADGVGKWNPALAVGPGNTPLVAWVDERDLGPREIPLEHIYFARGRGRGTRFGPNVRVDAGMPVRAARSLDNKWAPTVAVRGRRIYVAWTDFRNYNWDIFVAHSHNGAGFSANARVDDFRDLERLHDHPSVAVGAKGVVHTVWADRRDTAGDTNIMYARSTDGGRMFSANRQVDSSAVGFDADHDTASNQWNPRVAVSGADVFAVWQDNRLGNNDIFFVRSRDGGLTFETDERVDDSGDGPSNQYRPDLAVDDANPEGRSVYAVWEDDRRGRPAIYLARRLLEPSAR